jgi:hypothetical protein
MKEHFLLGNWKIVGFLLGLIWGIGNIMALLSATPVKLSQIAASTEVLIAMLPFYLTSRALTALTFPKDILALATVVLTLLTAIFMAVIFMAILELIYDSIAVDK